MTENKRLTGLPVPYDNTVYRTDSALTLPGDFEPVLSLVLAGLNSPHSKRAYSKALTSFLAWWDDRGRPRLSKALVLAYRDTLAHLSPRSVNLHMSAIRRLVSEAADNGLVDQATAQAIAKAKGAPARGVRSGNWLSKDQAERLLAAPPAETLGGLRDRAILALMIGAGLRRGEVAGLTFQHIQQRDGRWVILDLVGKRSKTRTVPIPGWVKAWIDNWTTAAGLELTGYIFRPVLHGGRKLGPGDRITPQAVYRAVETWTTAAGLRAAPHDLRRTWSKLAHKGGGDLAQISLTLGHESLDTTRRYLGLDLDLNNAPCDRLGLDLN